jgi:hypothetical protein
MVMHLHRMFVEGLDRVRVSCEGFSLPHLGGFIKTGTTVSSGIRTVKKPSAG